MRLLLILLASLALTACKPEPASRADAYSFAPGFSAPSCAAPPGSDSIEDILLAGVNHERAQNGLAPVRLHPSLRMAAQYQACDNAARGALSHTGMDGSGVGSRAHRAGYSYRMVAENLGLGVTSARMAVQGWMASPGHRANILKPEAVEAGMGLAATDDGRLIWALVLGQPR